MPPVVRIAALIAICACSRDPSEGAGVSSADAAALGSVRTPGEAAPAWVLPPLMFFPDMKTPPNNPLTAEKIVLGKTLFFDQRLGSGKTCSNCHRPDRGWSDGVALSQRASGRSNTRNTPSLYNVGYQRYWGWDGRSPTLEAHVNEEWGSQLAVSPNEASKRIAQDAGYDPLFYAAFGDHEITKGRVVHALACFVRSIRSGAAPYDHFERGDAGAIDDDAKRGWLVFRDKGGCTACHVPPLFTDNKFHNIGVGFEGVGAGAETAAVDLGRQNVTKKKRHRGAFKTPTLRSAVQTAPYFHDGSAATLEAAVDYVLSGGHANPQLDSSLTKLVLTARQRRDLIAFIRSLDAARP